VLFVKKYIDRKVENKLGILICCVKRVALLGLSQDLDHPILPTLVFAFPMLSEGTKMVGVALRSFEAA